MTDREMAFLLMRTTTRILGEGTIYSVNETENGPIVITFEIAGIEAPLPIQFLNPDWKLVCQHFAGWIYDLMYGEPNARPN